MVSSTNDDEDEEDDEEAEDLSFLFIFAVICFDDRNVRVRTDGKAVIDEDEAVLIVIAGVLGGANGGIRYLDVVMMIGYIGYIGYIGWVGGNRKCRCTVEN